MSNETKREALKRALNFFVATGLVRNINYDLERHQYLSEYDNALPDDLPVIPKAVSEYINDAKTSHYELLDAMAKWTLDQPVFDWIHENSDTFALAWVLCAWRVEETGEIVKLEAEK